MKLPRFHPPSAVFFGVLAVYLANGRPHPEVDCVAAPYTAWSLVRHGSFDLRGYPELTKYVDGHIREMPDGAWVSIRTPGSAIAAVPVYAPFAAFRETPFRDLDMHQIGKLASSLCLSCAAVCFFLLCRATAPRAAWPATVLFALGTVNWGVVSQALWIHGPAVLGLTAALWLLMKRGEGPPAASAGASLRYVLIGFALGFATLCRPTAGIFAAATVAALLVRRNWREAFFTSIGGVPAAVALLWYNGHYFGDPVYGGYVYENYGAKPPLWLGLSGLLVAPSRGLLVYSPALLLIFPGVWWLVRRSAPLSPGGRGVGG